MASPPLSVAIVSAALLLGCSNTASKPEPSTAGDALSYSFFADDTYQTVFIRILLQAQQCVPSVGLSRTQVTGETFEQTRSARVWVTQHGVAGSTTHMPIEIVTEENTTRVTVQNSLKRWNPYALAVKDWALHDSKACTSTATR